MHYKVNALRSSVSTRPEEKRYTLIIIETQNLCKHSILETKEKDLEHFQCIYLDTNQFN